MSDAAPDPNESKDQKPVQPTGVGKDGREPPSNDEAIAALGTLVDWIAARADNWPNWHNKPKS
jgi:hypothetical protein